MRNHFGNLFIYKFLKEFIPLKENLRVKPSKFG
jgi:hypothetical protein